MASKQEITTTIALDRATHKRLRLLAVEMDTTVRELVRQAVDDFLKKNGGKTK